MKTTVGLLVVFCDNEAYGPSLRSYLAKLLRRSRLGLQYNWRKSHSQFTKMIEGFESALRSGFWLPDFGFGEVETRG
ncbi:hypothetical protein BDW66DRAFT_131483 [Aspergillus desertorum]